MSELIIPGKDELPEPGAPQQARVYDGYKDAYKFADVHVANRECSVRNQVEPRDCPECHERVVVHCDRCEIQITGCTCSDTILHGRDYALKARATRPSHGAGMNRAQRRAAAKKRDPRLWTPNQIHKF